MIDIHHPALTIPLSHNELCALDIWLQAITSRSIFNTHGFLCAVITGPKLIPSHEWFPACFGHDLPNKVPKYDLQFNLDNVVRLSHDIAETLNNVQPFIPLIDFNKPLAWVAGNLSQAQRQALQQWCIGYLNGMEMAFNAWQHLPSFRHLYYCLTTLEQDKPTPISIGLEASALTPEQMNKVINDFIDNLPSLLTTSYQQAHQFIQNNSNLANSIQ